MEYENAIEINKLVKKYDGFTLGELDLTLPKGSIMGFVGQNGAGKSTTIKSILNIVRRDSGDIKIFGMDNVENEKQIKEDIAVVFDTFPFHDTLNAFTLDKILKRVYRKWNNSTFLKYLEQFNLPFKKKFGQFSKGMKMKLQIAVSLSHDAKLLIMDEATSGLDPVVRSEMLDVFMEYMQNEENSILMSSHITSDLERIADSIAFIHNGKIIMSGYKDDILEKHGIIKCSKDMLSCIAEDDIVSARISDFDVSVMIRDKEKCTQKYSGALIENVTLDDIMLFYVKSQSGREWRI